MDVNFRPFRTHEYILVFTNQFKKSTYNPQRVAVSESSLARHKVGKVVIKRNNTSHVSLYQGIRKTPTAKYLNDGKRHPYSVLSYSVPQGKRNTPHPTQKPLDLCEWLIKTYSNEGDLVVDTFAGSGTTLEACLNLNRNAIGCETHEPYIEISKNRIEQAQAELSEVKNQ
jgi:site-specific DNA-methyltransferase (adenine-specific)